MLRLGYSREIAINLPKFLGMKHLLACVVLCLFARVSDAQVLPGTGTNYFCVGTTTTVSSGGSGGTWSSSDTVVATIDSFSGVLLAISGGSTMLTYTAISDTLYFPVYIDTIQVAGLIGGDSVVCAGFTMSVNETVPGGNWSLSDTTIARMLSAGSISGLIPGTDSLFYHFSNSCFSFTTYRIITVNISPAPIAITPSICLGTALPATDSITGGSWVTLTGNTSVNDTGLVTALNTGHDELIYSLPDGCRAAVLLSIVRPPSPIEADSAICERSTALLFDSSTDGVWTSSDTTIGVVVGNYLFGVGSGVITITYSDSNACGNIVVTKPLTINPKPSGAFQIVVDKNA